MSDTSIQAALTPAVAPGSGVTLPAGAPSGTARPRPRNWFLQTLKALASLRLTVVLFVLSLVLVFFGTLAQIDKGIWTVVGDYFRSFVVWIPFKLLVQFGQVFFKPVVPANLNVPGSFPFPGGYVLGGALLVNLLAAHAVRFKISWKRSGILLIHAGLIILLVGELITGLFAVEGTMSIPEGGSADYVEHTRYAELAVMTPSATDPTKDDVVVVPASMLNKEGKRVSNPSLPFDIEVVRYMVNSAVKYASKKTPAAPATRGVGLRQVAVALPEVSGTDAEQRVDTPSAYLKLTDKESGADLGTYLFSLHVPGPQPLEVGGKTYNVALRFKRTYKPYSIYLIKFRFDRYTGTNTAKNFSSQVRLVDPEWGEDREVLIRMNEPLRHRGEAFYQHSFDAETEQATVLQVVRNPGWLLPYISCVVVALGMLVHFGLHLVGFLRRRFA
jgi:hypothetical protein